MNKPEQWKDVPGFEQYYQVSDLGRVRSLMVRTGCKRRQPRLKTLSVTRQGYLSVLLMKDYRTPNQKIENWMVHRLVLTVFMPNKDWSLDSCHNDGVKTNNELSNLRWGTRKENEHDKIAHGTKAVGIRNGQSKLDQRMATAIRGLHEKDGISEAILAKRFGICQQNVNSILRRKTWVSELSKEKP